MRIKATCITLLLLSALVRAQPVPGAGSAPTPQAAPAHGLGLKFADAAQYNSVPLAPHPLGADALPKHVSMDADFPTPGDQGTQSSCVGWAVAYALSSYQEHQRLRWGLTPDHLFSPAYIYNKIKAPVPTCQMGTSYLDALRVLTNEGVATLSEFPYNAASCTTLPSASVEQSAKAHRAANWRRVNVQDPLEVKAQLAAGYPVLIAMWVDQAFQALRGAAPYSAPSGLRLGGHAMVLTGYDDAKDAFRVMNSWGTGWGDGGFGWISYSAFTQTVVEGYVVLPQAPAPAPTPQPTPTPSPTPLPNPQPLPALPSATIATAGAQQVMNPQFVGIQASATGIVTNAQGRTGQLIYVFSVFIPNQGWVPVIAPPGSVFANQSRQVATGTQPGLVANNPEPINNTSMLPVFALPLGPRTNTSYLMAVEVQVWVDWQQIAGSGRKTFTFVW